MKSKVETVVAIAVNEDKRVLFNAVREHSQFAESWRDTVLNDWQAFDDHDPDCGGSCNFRIASMSEFRALVLALDAAKIRDWHLWFTIETDAVRASGGLGFRRDDDVMGDIRIDWAKLGDKARLTVKKAVGILEDIL